MQVEQFFANLWQDYTAITPQAQQIHALFTQRGETVINDHVAFRGFSDSLIDLAHLEPLILSLGYQRQDEYRFEKKKLIARSYIHTNPQVPLIFVSELQRHLLSDDAQNILAGLVSQIKSAAVADVSVFYQGLLWSPITLADYQLLSDESEYAGWLASLGLRANHFTVSLNHLKGEPEMQTVVDLLLDNDYAINVVGGAIKGVPNDLLVQSSTMADQIDMAFACGTTAKVPSCFYEFARRYNDANGKVFKGFLAANADKIFESTHRH